MYISAYLFSLVSAACVLLIILKPSFPSCPAIFAVHRGGVHMSVGGNACVRHVGRAFHFVNERRQALSGLVNVRIAPSSMVLNLNDAFNSFTCFFHIVLLIER